MKSLTSLRAQLLAVLGTMLALVVLAAFTAQTVVVVEHASSARAETCKAEARAVAPAAFKSQIAPENYDAQAMAVAFWTEEKMNYAQRMKRWEPLLAEASTQFGVPVNWLRAVMQLESGGRTMLTEKMPIRSTMGAMGLMQLMPETYTEMRKQLGLGKNAYDPHDNVFAAAAYLRWLHGRYGYPNMFAAYNDGPGNLEARLFDAGLLPRETQIYMSKITGVPIEQIQSPGTIRGPNLVKFTQADGSPVFIDLNAGPSVTVRDVKPGEFPDGVRSVVTVGKVSQGVWENVAMAQFIIKAHTQPATTPAVTTPPPAPAPAPAKP